MEQYSQENCQAQKKAFEDIMLSIELIRRCQTLEEYYYMQQNLEEHIDCVDEAAENAKQRKVEKERVFYHRLGHQYRTLGDAIAWQVYAFKALPIYVLGRNQFPGYRTRFKRKGLDEEKTHIKALWEAHGAFALHHDCTNCLRIGDLSIFYPDRLNIPEIEEIKVIGRETGSDQKRRMRIASELATHHFSVQDKLYDLLHLSYTSSPIKELGQTNLGLLLLALRQAKEKGVGFAANTYLAITVLDTKSLDTEYHEQVFQEWNETMNKMLFPDIWPVYCTDELRKDSWERSSHPNIGVPYTVYPLSSDYVAAIITGAVRIHYRLNTNAITEALRSAGFKAECLLGERRRIGEQSPRKAKAPYFQVQRQGIPITIGDLPIHQILFEGLREEDFVKNVVSWFDEEIWNKFQTLENASHRRPLQMFATYTDMEGIWASSRNYLLPINFQTDKEEAE
jgi:hypothetical protein